MRRLLLVAGVAVFVLAACGGSRHESVPHVGVIRPGPDLSPVSAEPVPAARIHAVAVARRRHARSEAEMLLHRIVLPSGAIRVRRVPVGRKTYVLRRPRLGGPVLTELADRYGYWRLRESAGSAVAFVERHRLPGFGWRRLHEWHGESRSTFLLFPGLQSGGHPMQHLLAMRFIPFHGATLVRIDAEAAWIYPRSRREVVQGDVREIAIHTLRRTRRLTDLAKIARVMAWFDDLDVVQPGPGVACLTVGTVPVKFVFRSASGATLASASVPLVPATGCDPIAFTSRGRRQRPLIDSTPGHGMAFVERVERLLGVRLGR